MDVDGLLHLVGLLWGWALRSAWASRGTWLPLVVNPGWLALLIASLAYWNTVRTRTEARERDQRDLRLGRERDRRDLFLRLHEKLIERDQQEGRDLVHREGSAAADLELMLRLRTDAGRDKIAKMNRSLATLDLLAYHLDAGHVDRDVVVEEWGYSLASLAEPARTYIRASARGEWLKRWPHLQGLFRHCEQWVARQPPSRPGA